MKTGKNIFKTILLTLVMVFLPVVLFADTDRAIAFEDLPDEAKLYIRENFPGVDASFVVQETDFMKLTYEVMLINGVDIEFNRKGKWTEIECRYGSLPWSLVPEQIRDRMKDWSDRAVRKISRHRKGYEIKLRGGLELIFDRKFNLVEIDD